LLASARLRLASTAKPSPPTSPLVQAALHHRLEQMAEEITLAKAPVPVLGKGGVVRHLALQSRRLDRCHRAPMDPLQAHRTVSEIAAG
jgi:hypothetical protein